MRKTRNSFFQESSFQQSFNPNYNMNPMPNQMPFQTAAGNYFYQGNNLGMNPGINSDMQGPNTNYTTFNAGSDIESRFAKIERQLNRLDYRISKIENSKVDLSSDDFDTSNTNMYML